MPPRGPKKADFLPSQHCDEHTRYTKGCEGCRLMINAYQRAIMRNKRLGRSARIPKLGTLRRLEALARLGYGWTYVARRLGTSKGNLEKIKYKHKWVTQDLAARVDALYRELEHTPANTEALPPHQKVTRAKATRRGWAPPAAWDDIDSDATATGVAPAKPKYADLADRLDEVAWLKSFGLTNEQIAKQMGVTEGTLERWVYRLPRASDSLSPRPFDSETRKDREEAA